MEAPSGMVECSDLLMGGSKRVHDSSNIDKYQLSKDPLGSGEDGYQLANPLGGKFRSSLEI